MHCRNRVAAVLLLLAVFSPARASLLDGVLITLNRTLIQQSAARIASRDASLLPAFYNLTAQADEVLRGLAQHGPYSVVNKSVTPPSGNKHDYISLDEYYWPCTCTSASPLEPPNCNATRALSASKPLPPRPCDNATGLPYVRHDGFLDPRIADYDFLQFSSLVSDTVTLALAFALSSNESYAHGAARVLRTWFINPDTSMRPNLEFAQIVPGVYPTGQHSGLIDANCHLPGVWDAVTLISSSPAWTASDNATIAQWGRSYNTWLQTSPSGLNESRLEHNNHATWMVVGLASGALWMDDVATAAEVLGAHARAAIVGQQIALNGSLPFELARTRSQFYTDFDLHAMFHAAWMSDLAHVKPGLFDYTSPENGTSIRLALDFLVPYAVHGAAWPWPEVLPYSYESLYDLFVRASVVWGNASYAAWAEALPGDHTLDIARLLWPLPAASLPSTRLSPAASSATAIDAYCSSSLRIRIAPEDAYAEPSVSSLTPDCAGGATSSTSLTNGNIHAVFATDTGLLSVTRVSDGAVLLSEIAPRVQVARGEVDVRGQPLFESTVTLSRMPDERVYGLGEHQTGVLDYASLPGGYFWRFEDSQNAATRGHNGDITLPLLHSSRGYTLMLNVPSYGFINITATTLVLHVNSSVTLDLWVSVADADVPPGTPPFASLMSHVADAIGHPAPLPTWATGFIQCKLRYRQQSELLAAAQGYASRGLPLAAIVIDFLSWPTFGSWSYIPKCWPDPAGMAATLDAQGVVLVQSVWPNIVPASPHFAPMLEQGYLTRNASGVPEPFNHFEGDSYIYDPFNEGARGFLGDALWDGYGSYGITAYWLDADEPQGAQPGREFTALGRDVEVGLAYPRFHQQAIYESQLAHGMAAPMSLSRGAWLGSARYGGAVWSGDIESTFSSLAQQVVIAQNMALSGVWTWTTDVGGFRGGDMRDPVFLELVPRWFQAGAFHPLFRVHGDRNPSMHPTQCGGAGAPTEVWAYGDTNYGILSSLLFLRERLRDYIADKHELAMRVGTPLITPLFFHFADAECSTPAASSQFVFGGDWLVSPVTEYGARNRSVYLPTLPSGEGWVSFYDGVDSPPIEGGQWRVVDTPVETFPLFFRSTASAPDGQSLADLLRDLPSPFDEGPRERVPPVVAASPPAGPVEGARPSAASLPPAVYWHTSPVPLHGTVLFAGSFGNSPTVYACTDGAACASPIQLNTSLAYNASIAFAVPDECMTTPPVGGCAYRLCNSAGCVLVSDINAPDVWFALAHPPLRGSSFVPGPVFGGEGVATLVNGGADSTLRVMGRSLTFAQDNLECVPATARAAAATTTLQLAPGAPLITAQDATCWEVSFKDLAIAIAAAGGGPSFPSAVLRTQFGSFPLPLLVVPPPPPASLTTVIDVDADAAGDVTVALALAAATPGDKLVVLGAHPYALSMPLNLSDHTVLEGAGATLSTLVFTLSGQYGTQWGIAGSGSHWGVRSLGVTVLAAPPDTPAVWMRANTSNLTVSDVAIVLQQVNVSNAVRIEGAGWVVADSDLEQGGECFWPPESENTPFQASVTLYLHGATDGFFHRNTLRWQCAAFDMDVSSRVVFEDNVIQCTQRGVIPHGNSISFYDWAHVPSSQGFLYAHNTQSRPADNNRTDWAFHESLTTDGPGGWGAGVLGGIDGVLINVPHGLTDYLQAAGATALVVAGSGAGQWRTVISRPNLTSVELSAPFDDHVIVGESIIGVMATVGGKLIVGNTFNWGSVVQEFGTTLTGVFADNAFDHQNNAFADSGGIDGSLTGFGLCYGSEPQPMFFVEYMRNVMASSNGISLHDVPNANCDATYPGPYIRWASIRGNTIGGIAPSNPGVCGSINATNPETSDLVVEGNTFACAPGNLLPCGNGVCVAAAHSVVQPADTPTLQTKGTKK